MQRRASTLVTAGSHEPVGPLEPVSELGAAHDREEIRQILGDHGLLRAGSRPTIEAIRPTIAVDLTPKVVEARSLGEPVRGLGLAEEVAGRLEDGSRLADEPSCAGHLAEVRVCPRKGQEGEAVGIGRTVSSCLVQPQLRGRDRLTMSPQLAEALGPPDQQPREHLQIDGLGRDLRDVQASGIEAFGQPGLNGKDVVAPAQEIVSGEPGHRVPARLSGGRADAICSDGAFARDRRT